MSRYGIDGDTDITINNNLDMSLSALLVAIKSDPAFIQEIALLVRNEIVGPMARRMGNTAKHTAQKHTPLAAKPTPPATQRVF